MLARLTLSTARLLDVRIEQATHSSQQMDEGESTLVVDLDALSALLLPLPNSSWHRAAGACHRALRPICNNIQNMIITDLDNVAQLLLTLESQFDDTLHDSLPIGLLTPPNVETATSARRSHSPTPEHRRRRRHTGTPIVIPNTHPSVPTIVITLSPRQSREMSSRVPYQDQAFGNLLTVPSHPVFNKVHPPMALSNPPSLPNIDEWEWIDGHWEAVLPSLKEQDKRGLFSKPVSLKKRCRTPRHSNNTSSTSRAI